MLKNNKMCEKLNEHVEKIKQMLKISYNKPKKNLNMLEMIKHAINQIDMFEISVIC